MNRRLASPGRGVNAGALALALVLGACSVSPTRPVAAPPMPARYAEARGWAPTRAPAAVPTDRWWRVFGDPELDRLERELDERNQTLAGQYAAYQQARAALDAARAAYFPVFSGGLSASRGGGAGRAVATSLGWSTTASWEPDLWGRVRHQVEAAGAGAAASADTLAGTRLSLQASLATSVLQLRVIDAQRRLADQTVAAYAQALHLNENRYRAGVVSMLDVAQARAQWLQARAARTDLEVTRAQLQHAIAVLAGRWPEALGAVASERLGTVPRIPPGRPATLLLRRPDLRAAHAQVAAANAQLGLARTAWFPTLTLDAQAGGQGPRLADLFSAPTLFWSLGPALAATLFDGGLRQAQLASASAAYRERVANYRQAVLVALQQVEDDIAAQRLLAREARQQAEVIAAASEELRLARNQYLAGTVDYLSVITAQTTLTSARNAALQLRGRRYGVAVALIAALGGGWGEHGAGRAPATPHS